MNRSVFNDNDRRQMRNLGIQEEKAISQIEMLKKGTPYMKLDRPCRIGDGIKVVSEEEFKKFITIYESSAGIKRLIKFVPASGAATRMLKELIYISNKYEKIERDFFVSENQQKDSDSQQILTFMDNIRRFAFYDELKSVMARDNFNTEALVDCGQYKEIIEYLLLHKGLGYSQLPKGLFKFHKYADGSRTAFEEHLEEAVKYMITDNKKVCSLHFTVSPEHKHKFDAFFESIRYGIENAYGIRFDISYSIQKKSTNTIAIDMEENPFRLDDGTILFRPGGHGALIENLNRIEA